MSYKVGTLIRIKISSTGADKLPLSSALKNNLSDDDAKHLALTAGDDYELCFTVSPQHELKFNELKMECVCIGEVTENIGLQLKGYNGEIKRAGYQHFKE